MLVKQVLFFVFEMIPVIFMPGQILSPVKGHQYDKEEN